jgi:hypothetical protein
MQPSNNQTKSKAVANIPLATKARQVEAWLGALPQARPLENARQLADYLAVHDRDELATTFRKHLLDTVLAFSRPVLNAIEAEFRDMPLPMDAVQLDHVDHAVRLLNAAAAFSLRLIVDSAGRSPPLFGENPLPGHISRFLHLQREIMDLCHLSHRQLPDGFWRDGHRIGQMLAEGNLAASPDPLRPSGRLGEIYLAIVLEALADPYHFSEQERLWTRDFIDRHGHLAVFGSARSEAISGVFGIRVGEDKPPYPLVWHNETVPNCDLLLNTAPLVRKLALAISQLERDRMPPQALPAVRHPAYRELLSRLKSTWSGSAQRTTARHRPARVSQRKAIVGFYPVYRYLTDPTGESDRQAVAQCQLVNESLGGMALQVAQPGFRLKIGTLVCVGRGQGDAWKDIGLVRWFKTGANGALTFGVKYLHGRIHPVMWNLKGDGQTYPGLLAEPDKENARLVRSLVAPSLRIDPQATLDIKQDGRRYAIRLAGKSESLPDIDLFRLQ